MAKILQIAFWRFLPRSAISDVRDHLDSSYALAFVDLSLVPKSASLGGQISGESQVPGPEICRLLDRGIFGSRFVELAFKSTYSMSTDEIHHHFSTCTALGCLRHGSTLVPNNGSERTRSPKRLQPMLRHEPISRYSGPRCANLAFRK